MRIGDDERDTIDLTTCFDVLSKEVFAIRKQLTTLITNQDSGGWDKDFTKAWLEKATLYSQYVNHYRVEHYQSSDNVDVWGCVILIIGDDILGDTCNKVREIGIENLIKLHNTSINSIPLQEGRTIELYLYEKGVYEDKFGTKDPLIAEIITIKVSSEIYFTVTEVTLKIDIGSSSLSLPGTRSREPIYITRTIKL